MKGFAFVLVLVVIVLVVGAEVLTPALAAIQQMAAIGR
jgi:Ca2+/Na+ antiporter